MHCILTQTAFSIHSTMNSWLKTLLISALTACAPSIWALDAQQIFERVAPSVVVIKAGDSLGSGVVYLVDNSGLTPSSTILTNCHVVKGYTHVTVERLGKQANATVKVCDADRDMAIITLGGVLPTLTVRTTPLKVGEPAFAVGAPQGLELSISQGIVSQLRLTPLGKDPMIQTTAAISQGSSGGGLFDSEGRLIGLTTLYYKEGQSLNFAVPLSFVAALKNTSASRPTANSKPSPNSPSQQCGWTLLGKADSYEHYIDFCKISGTGRYRFAWIMNDYKNPDRSHDGKYLYSSDTIKWVYDCQLSRHALTAHYRRKANMAQGAVMYSSSVPENQWKFSDPAPGSPGALNIETVCK
jgi:Trypsin-like peptidase domain